MARRAHFGLVSRKERTRSPGAPLLTARGAHVGLVSRKERSGVREAPPVGVGERGSRGRRETPVPTRSRTGTRRERPLERSRSGKKSGANAARATSLACRLQVQTSSKSTHMLSSSPSPRGRIAWLKYNVGRPVTACLRSCPVGRSPTTCSPCSCVGDVGECPLPRPRSGHVGGVGGFPPPRSRRLPAAQVPYDLLSRSIVGTGAASPHLRDAAKPLRGHAWWRGWTKPLAPPVGVFSVRPTRTGTSPAANHAGPSSLPRRRLPGDSSWRDPAGPCPMRDPSRAMTARSRQSKKHYLDCSTTVTAVASPELAGRVRRPSQAAKAVIL